MIPAPSIEDFTAPDTRVWIIAGPQWGPAFF